MPIISVVLAVGRTNEQKQALCRALTEAAIGTVDVRPDQVRVVIQETALENYAVGGVTFAERQAGIGDGAMK